MEGKNKKIEQQIPDPASAKPKTSIGASHFGHLSPSNLPLPPSSPYHVWQKPYFMKHVGAAGANSSGTKTSFFQGSNPLFMKGENNKNTDQKPSPPSGQNLALQTSADDNSVKSEVGDAVQVRRGRTLDTNMDPRKLKRVISNRLSAQKSRIKKLQYLTDMEKKVESLQTLIAVLSPQVAQQRNKKYLLQMEQNNLNQRLTACANRKMIVEAEIEERKAEVNRLRQLNLAQQQQKMQAAQTSWGVWGQGLTDQNQQMVNPGLNQFGVGQTIYVDSNHVDGGDNMAELNRLNQLSLNQQQENPGQFQMPGWEPGRGQQTDVGLNQFEPWQVQNPSLNQSNQQQTGSFNSNYLEGLEEILNINPENHQNPRNDFI
ncbi:hypothetical protein REPUB_Repub05bG0201700 [Reevesia pubescens]